jgi:hypothetical protein
LRGPFAWIVEEMNPFKKGRQKLSGAGDEAKNLDVDTLILSS